MTITASTAEPERKPGDGGVRGACTGSAGVGRVYDGRDAGLTGHVFELLIVMEGVDGSSAMTQLTVTDNTSVLSVNNDGEAYGHRSGWATVTVTTSNGPSAQLTVVGEERANPRVAIAPASPMVGEGMTEKTEAQVYYSNSAYITANEVDMAGIGEFTIGNPSIATVDAYGT